MSTRTSLQLMYDSNRRINEHRNAETQRLIHATNLCRWEQQFQTLREHSQAAIHYKPYSPNTPLIQPTIGGGLSVKETRSLLVLTSTFVATFGTLLITDCCITTNMCPVMIASGSVGGCVCLTCTAYHVADYYYQKNPFCLETPNQQQNPPETNAWSWVNCESCGV